MLSGNDQGSPARLPERVWGRKVEHLYENPRLWEESIHPEDRQRAQDALERWVVAGPEAKLDLDYRVVRPDGQIRWIQDRGVKIVGGQERTCRFAGVATDITDRKRVEEALREREQQLLQALDDREAISQDLHDGVLQLLYAVGLGLESCKPLVHDDPRQALEQMDQAIAQLNSVLRDVRQFIAGLDGYVPLGVDLEKTLQNLVRKLTRAHNTQVKLSVDASAASRLTRNEATHLTYIVQEALSNSLRHGAAATGGVWLGWREDSIHLEVWDDGTGFDVETARGWGHGLGNMASRAQKLGGQLRIGSQAGQGTRVSLDLSRKA